METVTLVRQFADDTGTYGTISVNDRSWVTLELPWRDNEPNVSCIPTGKYNCTFRFSPAHNRNVYHIEDVPNRSNCEIHAANLSSQLLGCIAIGRTICIFNPGAFKDIDVPVKGINDSKIALAEFESELLTQPFVLVISNA